MDADVIVETDGVPAQWAIAGAAGQWARWQKWPASRISAFSSAASELFGARFGGLETIPGIAEIEAALK